MLLTVLIYSIQNGTAIQKSHRYHTPSHFLQEHCKISIE